ncbi:MAG: hypothetical protein ACRERV_14480 [Methylococcales bacterium]
MSTAKVYLVIGLLSLVLSSLGCGQKGPLYQDKTPEVTAKPAKIEDEERRKKREGWEQRNESQPGIAYWTMDHFYYQDNRPLAENVPLAKIAECYGTPCYVYSRATLERHLL